MWDEDSANPMNGLIHYVFRYVAHLLAKLGANRGKWVGVGVDPRVYAYLTTQFTPQDPYFNRSLSEPNSSPLPDFSHQVSILPLAATVTAVACSAAFPTIGSRMTPMKAPAALLGLFQEGLRFEKESCQQFPGPGL